MLGSFMYTLCSIRTIFTRTSQEHEALTLQHTQQQSDVASLYSDAAMPKLPVLTSFAASLHCSSTEAHH